MFTVEASLELLQSLIQLTIFGKPRWPKMSILFVGENLLDFLGGKRKVLAEKDNILVLPETFSAELIQAVMPVCPRILSLMKSFAKLSSFVSSATSSYKGENFFDDPETRKVMQPR